MNLHTHWLPAIGLIALVIFSTGAQAAAPALCFQTEDDYRRYQAYGDEIPPLPDIEEVGEDKYNEAEAEAEKGPPKRKSVNIRVSQSVSGDNIIADASASTTPSGEKKVAWGKSDIISSAAQYSSRQGSSGSYKNIQLHVSDPVCGVSASEQVRIVTP